MTVGVEKDHVMASSEERRTSASGPETKIGELDIMESSGAATSHAVGSIG